MLAIILPWPPKELSPNARVHWGKRSKAAKAYRNECSWRVRGYQLDIAIKTGRHVEFPSDGKLHLFLDFYPPDRRHRDDDNMIASFKSGRDGIADALGIDDKRFVVHPFVSDQIGGIVKVRIERSAA